jgi:TrmH family RNA methyltransferase
LRSFGLAPGVMEKIADTVSPQPICAVVALADRPIAEVCAAETLLVLLEVRDPGNVGAIIRSADAAGVGGLVTSERCADLFNPKTVRASAGSLFHLPIAEGGEAAELLDGLRARGYRLLGAVAHSGEDYATVSYDGKVALVFGNEAHGIDETLASRLDATIHIPTTGGAESLNVAMAATVLCFELARARRDLARGPQHEALT